MDKNELLRCCNDAPLGRRKNVRRSDATPGHRKNVRRSDAPAGRRYGTIDMKGTTYD